MDDKIYEQMYTVVKIFMRKKKGYDIVQNIIEFSGLASPRTINNKEQSYDVNSQSSVYHLKKEINSH